MHQTADDILITHWDDFLEGDTLAYSHIMQACYPDLFKYGSRFTTDNELIKDCIQNIFLTLWKNRSTIGHTAFVRFYLLKALRREIHKQLKKQNKIGDFEELSNTLFDLSLNPETRIVDHETSGELTQKIRRILEGIPKRQQEIIYLRFYANADTEQIARIMSISRQSVYNLLHDALKKLKTFAENFLISLLLYIQFITP